MMWRCVGGVRDCFLLESWWGGGGGRQRGGEVKSENCALFMKYSSCVSLAGWLLYLSDNVMMYTPQQPCCVTPAPLHQWVSYICVMSYKPICWCFERLCGSSDTSGTCGVDFLLLSSPALTLWKLPWKIFLMSGPSKVTAWKSPL